MRQLFGELKRRNVYKVAATYVVVAFVGLQAVDLLIPATTLPPWVDEFLVALAVFGFPVALVLTWAFELTPEGVRRTPGTATPEEGPEPAGERRSRSRLAVTALVALGLVAAAVAGGWYLTGGGGESVEVSERTVAVLPFQVSGAGADTWRDGMVSLLSTNLDGAAGIRTIAPRTVFAALEEGGLPSGEPSTEEALAVARRVGARYAVVGSASQLGGELQLTARLHETGSGNRLEQAEIRGSPDSVTALTDSLTRRVLAILLDESGGDLPSANLASLTTSSIPALKSYLQGERHFRAGQYEAAARDYSVAVERDSAFALAYSRLATTRWMVVGSVDTSLQHLRRAYELSDELPRRERRFVQAQYSWLVAQRPEAAADSLRRWTEVYPDDPSVWNLFGEVLWHNSVPSGWPEADRAFEQAVELDPGVAIYHLHLVNLAFSVHHDSALAARRIDAQPSAGARRSNRLSLDLVFGSDERRRRALARLDTMPPTFEGSPFWQVLFNLQHPSDLEVLERVLHRLRARDDLNYGSAYNRHLLEIVLWRGRIEETLRIMGVLGLNPTVRSCSLAEAMTLGYPVPDSVAKPLLDPSEVGDDATIDRLVCAGLYLIERGRSDDLQRVLGDLRERAAVGSQSGEDPSNEAQSAIKKVEGYRAWDGGNLDRAEEQWSGWKESGSFGQHGAIWRGDLHRDLEDLEKAEGWYLAAWPHPVAHERLGQIYEEMRRPEDAAAAYRRFIAVWEDADPELQDRVETARERVQELTASEAETD